MYLWTLGIPTSVALAAVAVLGYLFGRGNRKIVDLGHVKSRRELKRAKSVIRQLETIAGEVRRSLATHHTSILRFKDRIAKLSGSIEQAARDELCQEAEKLLSPTVRLAAQLSHAYDEIRQQTNLLMTFHELRTDKLTGLSNRQALDDALEVMFSMMSRYDTQFSLVIFDIDHFQEVNDKQGHSEGDRILQQVARLLDGCVRETDIVTRYGGEEFIIVLPQTDLSGACVICDRLRTRAQEELPVTMSGGLAMALDGDSPKTLLARADAALYSAKTTGCNSVSYHTGSQIEALEPSQQEQAGEQDELSEYQPV